MRLFFLLCLLSLGGCQAGYYAHLVGGHLGLMGHRQPLEEALAGDLLTEHQRHQLQLSQALLSFANERLALPTEKVYRHYVALPEAWVVWNLFAAEEFSLQPHQWCYPLIGCAGYRGYFSATRAQRDKQRLEEKGLQVFGAGAIAYSTLGWFSDPLTSAMLDGDDVWFAELIFHELVHRRYYLKGDTRFNESLATAVAREGVRRWLAAHGDPAQVRVLEQRDQAQRVFLVLVGSARQRLEALYASGLPAAQMRQAREQILASLRQEYQTALQQTPALAVYQQWFAGPLNNAQLNMVSDYYDQVPLFDAALLECGGNWPCFWRQVKKLARLSPEQRAAITERLND
ncbi:aminopeptidase [Alcanivorax sp. 1008]|uniref:aminopeptidase n=1 Tax=Alcanivorax sp. 1008 TaxID=2816853 RepID=UPI001E59DAEB|nr:aminopeptidase [Alcanivorax sp. 1008]